MRKILRMSSIMILFLTLFTLNQRINCAFNPSLDRFPWQWFFSDDSMPKKKLPDKQIIEEYLLSQVGLKRFGCRLYNDNYLPFLASNGFYNTEKEYNKCAKNDSEMLYSTLKYADADEFRPSKCDINDKKAKDFMACLEDATNQLKFKDTLEYEALLKYFKFYYGECKLDQMPWSDGFYESIDREQYDYMKQSKRNAYNEKVAICRKSDIVYLYITIIAHDFDQSDKLWKNIDTLKCNYTPKSYEMLQCIRKTSHQFARLAKYLNKDIMNNTFDENRPNSLDYDASDNSLNVDTIGYNNNNNNDNKDDRSHINSKPYRHKRYVPNHSHDTTHQCNTGLLINQHLLVEYKKSKSSNLGLNNSTSVGTIKVIDIVEEAKAFNTLLISILKNNLDDFIFKYDERLKDQITYVLACLKQKPLNPFIIRLLKFENANSKHLSDEMPWMTMLNRKIILVVICVCSGLIMVALCILIAIPLLKLGKRPRHYRWSEILGNNHSLDAKMKPNNIS